jgi:uncharacterized protein (TIGR03032 family)
MEMNEKTEPKPDAAQEAAPSGGLAANLEISASRQFPAWLVEHKVSFAFTTYQAGKLFIVGVKEEGRLSLFERTFSRCMGLWGDGETLWMSSLYQLWRFDNALQPGQLHRGYDRLYVPQVGSTTGDLDIHDVGVTAAGEVVFVNTLFGCLASLSVANSFTPVWKPPFISRLAAEDRCHLNGLAMENGEPRYVTAVSQSDVVDGRRDRRRDGGCVIEVPSGDVIVTGLSMPHSPRIYRDKLWVLDSGTGEFGWIDRKAGTFESVASCPGYLRGLCFVEDFAVIGLSKPRDNTFSGLALHDNLAARETEPWCGILVNDLRTGDIVHWLRLEGVVTELYDVVALPAVIRPMALGFRTDEIRRTITVGDLPPEMTATQ